MATRRPPSGLRNEVDRRDRSINNSSQSRYEGEEFMPTPNVPRRYTVAQLLLLGEILPYVMCRRDRLHDNAFRCYIVKIKGLRNESTHDNIIDEYIIRKQVKQELARKALIMKKGYQYLQRFKDSEQDLRVKALWVEIHAAKPGSGGYRSAYRPSKMTEEELEAAVTFGQKRKDRVENPRYPPRRPYETESEPVEKPSVPAEVSTPSPPAKKSFEGPATKWGTPYGYKVENFTPTNKPPPNLGTASSGQDQLAYIQYMLQAPLAPVVTSHTVNSTSNGEEGGKTSEESLKESFGKSGIKYIGTIPKATLTPVLTPHVVSASAHRGDGSRTSVSDWFKDLDLKSSPSRNNSRSSVRSLKDRDNMSVNFQGGNGSKHLGHKVVKDAEGVKNAASLIGV